jgi:hypothetical protein
MALVFTMYLSNGNADLGCHCAIVQGAHPFTPYAITSPNGNADATVRYDIFRLIFLVLSMGSLMHLGFVGNYCCSW